METAIKADVKKIIEKLPEIAAAKRRLSAHIKKYGTLKGFNDTNIKFVKPL